MPLRFVFAALAAAVISAAPVAAASAPRTDAIPAVMTAAIDKVIIPGYQALHKQAEELAGATRKLCEAPSPEALSSAREDFSQTVAAWGRVEMIGFGPAADENRSERILFYPDPRGIGLRQVQAVLAEKDDSVTTLEGLTQKSVAVQGLGALEFVLFGTGSDELATDAAKFRCAYAAAIGENIETIAGELVDAWSDPDGISQDWKNPGAAGSAFHNPQEALNDVLGALMHGIEAVRDVRIAAFLAETPSRDKPKKALFWRSASTMPLIVADLEGMKALFEKGRMASVLPKDEEGLAGLIDYGFSTAIEQAKAIEEPLSETLADIPNRQKFLALNDTLANLKNRLGNEYGPAIGLSTGFSFADGD